MLNAAASLVLAVPVTIALASPQVSTTTVPVSTATPAPVVSDAPSPGRARDVLPRDPRHLRPSPQSELLLLPSSLRPALR